MDYVLSKTSLCVTSFGPSGYDLYGRTFLETFVKHVDCDLVVYIEGQENRPLFSHPRVTFRDLTAAKGLQQTLAITSFPAARGMLWGNEQRNYRFDVHKFCRKSFAQIDAAVRWFNEGGEALYWIDADVEFFSGFPLPNVAHTFMLYLGRPEWHSCASFVGWNLKHAACQKFFDRYLGIYTTGTVFALPEWHDSYILDWLRAQLNVPADNLATGLDLKGPANVFDEVFSSARHKKGNLKFRQEKN